MSFQFFAKRMSRVNDLAYLAVFGYGELIERAKIGGFLALPLQGQPELTATSRNPRR